ncbi:MAG: lamin tail domain-containing protein [Phycisphaerae bacterium]|nr:lamin tail domain-containing protein [Phycisphaerae bacterium]
MKQLYLLLAFCMGGILHAATFTVNTPELGDLTIVEADPYKSGDTPGNTLRAHGVGYWGAMDTSTIDNLWRERTIDPFFTGYEDLTGTTDRLYELSGDDKVNAPELVTTISDLASASYDVFLVHVYRIDTSSDTSMLLAGLEPSPVYICDRTTFVSQLGTATGTWGVGITPIGNVVGNEISVYIKGTISSSRCDYIGVAYKVSNSCANMPPTIVGPNVLSTYAYASLVVDVDVTDDGKPYIQGCDPNYPDLGTSYELQYKWSQLSGPAPISFDPVAVDAEDVSVTFTLAGTYELLLQITDGPLGQGIEDGKTGEYVVTVVVLEPLVGDIDHDGVVDLQDLSILVSQWLGSCPDQNHCADLDDSGIVSTNDFSLLASNWQVDTSKVVISEFVASNRSSFFDGDGNASDWIELHNQGSIPVSLDDWYLTDSQDDLQKWPFPTQTVLPAGGYLVVFASGQSSDNYVDAKGYYHTNFALSKDGEYLALVNSSGKIEHEYTPSFPIQTRDISYGLWFTEYRYFADPTPSEPNTKAFIAFTDKTSHSQSRGFYDQPFSLMISCATPDVFIRYTLDGSEPTEQHGLLYNPATSINITTTTNLRSATFKSGWLSGGVTTDTYIFVDDVASQPADPVNWPVSWGQISQGTVPADYQMDPRVVDNTLPGYSVRDALLDIPTVSISMAPDDFISDATGIYANPLERWERKCSVEYIYPDGTKGFQDDCKIEIHGNSSRNPYRMQKHSLRLTFTSLYGASKLDYPLFAESDVAVFNQLVLRACFTDSWALVSWSSSSRYRPNDSQYIRDIWMKESLKDMGQPSSFGNYTHLYVNGLYFGIHNLSERLSDDFFADHLGGKPEDWEINADFSSPGSRWNTMMSINPSTVAGYDQIQDYLDVRNFADYMLLHFYADSEDWPHHNGYAAANAVSGDGKFRFFAWDQEIVLDYHGRAATKINNSTGAGALFQKMRTSKDFCMLFADRVQKHCFNDGALNITNSQARYRDISSWIDKAIVAESARWGDTQMSTPYGNPIEQPASPDDINDNLYPQAPHAPDYYFTREDSWVIERDNIINNYIPAIHDTANSYAIINVFRNTNLFPSIDAPVFNVNGVAQYSGYASVGDSLTITNPNASGTIYYTLDNSDPRLPGGLVNPDAKIFQTGQNTQQVAIVETGATWKYLYDGSDQGTIWLESVFNDESWGFGPGQLGFGDGDEATDVGPKVNGRRSAYFRKVFNITNVTEIMALTVNMLYDDGAVIYINGTEVARCDMPTGVIAYDTLSSVARGDNSTIIFTDIDPAILNQGDNILAVEVHQHSDTSSDISFDLSMYATVIADSGEPSQEILNNSSHVKARIFSNAQWSALSDTVYSVGPVMDNLRITEIMYHPQNIPTGDPNSEFIELQNIGTEPINLNLVQFDKGIDFIFPNIQLASSDFVVVVKDQEAFTSQYPQFNGTIAGEYTGNLDNGGERLRLLDAIGGVIHDFKYKDSWYDITDGQGFSLTVRDAINTDPNQWIEKSTWASSTYKLGTPGADDNGPRPGDIVINEVLAHSNILISDWIELYNTTDREIDLSGWFLSDDADNLQKYEIASGVTVAPLSYIVFTQTDHFSNDSDPGCNDAFALSENGETVYLSSGSNGQLTGLREKEEFGASLPDVSVGRYENSTGDLDFVMLSQRSPGAVNDYPQIGPIVIS